MLYFYRKLHFRGSKFRFMLTTIRPSQPVKKTQCKQQLLTYVRCKNVITAIDVDSLNSEGICERKFLAI